MGRPTKYKEEYANIAFAHAKLGATLEDLAKAFQVNVDTIHEWRHVHIAFSDAIKNGRDYHDSEQVEQSLLKRATGYKRVVERLDKDGCIHEVREEVPPDPVSMIFWLKNRQPKRWRDKQEIEHSGEVKNVISAEPLTAEQWAEKYARKD